jgi:hypothetical protein
MSDPAQLLAMMQNDPAAARQLLEANMAEQAASNPMMAMMMQMMSSRRAEENRGPEDKRARIERVRRHLSELRSALSTAHDLLDDVAAALGACSVCWGGTDDCDNCRGRGVPGWRMPDDELFTELVAPAVKRRAQGQPTKGSNE